MTFSVQPAAAVRIHPARVRLSNRYVAAARRQMQVLHALMLHDIKSRFFGSGLGYIATILWPGTHIAVIIGVFYFTGRSAPYGSDKLLYASVGALPYIIWNYVSRFTHLGVLMNKSFLNYPIVKPLDLMIARQALELVSCTIIVFAIIIFLACCGSDFYPHRPDEAAYAIFSAVLLGVGFGILGGVFMMIFPMFGLIYFGVLIGFWITSGLVINPEAMPDSVGYALSWVPLMHCVEWLRYAYYDDFPARLLDRTYVIGWGAGTLVLGLVLERLLRLFTTR